MTQTAEPDPFAPDGTWQGLSPRYAVVRLVTTAITNVVFWAIVATASFFMVGRPELTFALAAAGAIWTAWRLWRVRRWVNSWRWTERDADLCIARGLWHRQLTVVPIGRMQLVEVSAGPLLRWQGLAGVQLVTAAAHTNAHIPGLDKATAVALRDRLIERSDAEGSGL